MTSELPPGGHRYRRSQTPESPRPMHVPEPSNIPVLQNQMDPVFNDTTTYDIPPDPSSALKSPGTNDAENAISNTPLQLTSALGLREGYLQAQGATDVGEGGSPAVDLNGTTENQAISTNSLALSSNATAPDLQHTLASLAHFTENDTSVIDQGQPPNIGDASTKNDTLPKADARDNSSHSQSDTAERSSSFDPISKGVNYQTLLDTLSQSTSRPAIVDPVTTPITASGYDEPTVSQTGSEKPLPVGAGLPPRPPPQEKPAMHPNYSPNESIRSFHQLPPQNVSSTPHQPQTTSYRSTTGLTVSSSIPLPQTNVRAANGLPPPPVATFQQPSTNVAPNPSPSGRSPKDVDGSATASLDGNHKSEGIDDEEQPWGTDIQKKYDEFLHDERKCVTEGVWDRFPPGSRLFVGNLPTEKVTKRDLFHIFHRHGKLAQISLKQAYGFVQFLEASSCYDALSREQNMTIRGRKVHLEISKPQKGNRNSGPADSRALPRRRSRSPERRRGGIDRVAQHERIPFSDFRDAPARRRDEYRPMRSPSPHGLRNREDYRTSRSPPSFNSYVRPRSPLHHRDLARFRSLSPSGFEDATTLPLPRREPRDVPDVQILVLEVIDQNFCRYIEHGFKLKGLQAATIYLNSHITLAAVVKRQIIEGVQAVVKLTRTTESSHRIPLQVFDRGMGATSVNFHEYVDLDVSVAADIVMQARHKERTALLGTSTVAPSHVHSFEPPRAQYQYSLPPIQAHAPPYFQQYQPAPAQPIPAYQPPREPPYSTGRTMLSHESGGQKLQELLANLQQMPQSQSQTPHLPVPNGGTPDLGALLSNVARQQNQPRAYPVQQFPQPSNTQFGQDPSMPPNYSTPTNISSYGGSSTISLGQSYQTQDVQDLMAQIAKLKQ